MAIADTALSDYEFERRLDFAADAELDPEPDSTCPECGFQWNCGYIPASRFSPADALYPECPRCGC
jgi:hypothetical protein